MRIGGSEIELGAAAVDQDARRNSRAVLALQSHHGDVITADLIEHHELERRDRCSFYLGFTPAELISFRDASGDSLAHALFFCSKQLASAVRAGDQPIDRSRTLQFYCALLIAG